MLSAGQAQAEVPQKHVVSGCSECQRLSVMSSGGCVTCDQGGDLLCVVAELWEEVEWLIQNSGESEEDVDWWSCSLPSL